MEKVEERPGEFAAGTGEYMEHDNDDDMEGDDDA